MYIPHLGNRNSGKPSYIHICTCMLNIPDVSAGCSVAVLLNPIDTVCGAKVVQEFGVLKGPSNHIL